VLVTVARLLAALLLFAGAGLASAQQYRWTDEQGRVHYTDTPPPPSAKDVRRKGPASAAPEQASAPAVRVTLYTSPNCDAPCRDARRLLEQRGVAFSEISVFDAASLAELKRAAGAERIPALVVGTKALVGLSPKEWNTALDAAGFASSPSAGAAKPRALPPVSLYTNSECGPLCTEARNYLQEQRIQFTEVPVEEPADVAKLRSLTGQQNVPVLTVGNIVQRGYDPGLYARALSAAGYPPRTK
jgi:glutaredoxin